MQVSNTKYYYDQDFEEYIKMEGVSYSSLKGEEIVPTEGMRLGTRVHHYMNEAKHYDWQDAEMVGNIARQLRAYIGDAFRHLEKEVAFTSQFTHNGMQLAYKGRADMMKAGRIIIDLKVLGGPLPGAIERFGYDRQISGYCLATGCSLGLIVAWNKLQKRVETRAVKPDAAFWEYTTVRMGKPISETGFIRLQNF